MESLKTSTSSSKPIIFDRSIEGDKKELETLAEQGLIKHVSNEYEAQLREVYVFEHPGEVFSPDLGEKIRAHLGSIESMDAMGKWIFFPWLSTLVHLLDDDKYQKLRFSRNKLLISEEEQANFYNSTIGVAGLSVGNSVALTIALQGGAKHLKIADHDTLEVSNLNRIRAGVDSLGLSKVEMTARQIYLLNPYANIELFPEGLTEESTPKFFEGLDIMIDEIDNLSIKYQIREEASKRRIPVIMAADNDRSSVLDIERYDLDPQPSFFHGRLGSMTKKDLSLLDKRGIGRTIAGLIGLENHTARMLISLREMGKSVVSWPQLGGTALLSGSVVAYCAFRLANKLPIPDSRVIVALDSAIDADYSTPERVFERESAIGEFKKMLGL